MSAPSDSEPAIGPTTAAEDTRAAAGTEDAPDSDRVLRSVLGAIDCGVVVHAADGSIVASNQKALELLGLTADQLHGRTSFDPRWRTYAEDDTPFAPEHHPASIALRTGKRVCSVVMGVDRPPVDDGPVDRVWILVTAQPVESPGSTGPRVVVTFANIGDQLRAERALRAEHGYHKELMNTVLAGIVVLSDDGRITYANRRAATLTGMELGELEGRSYSDPSWGYFDLQGRPLPDARLPFAQVRRSQAPVWEERLQLRTPSGERRTLSINGAPLFDSKGAFSGGAFALHDITATEAARRELRLSEQRLRMAAWAADLALVEWVVEGELRIDEAWLRRRGWGDRPVPSTVAGWREILGTEVVARINRARDEHFKGRAPSIDIEFPLPTQPPTATRLLARLVERRPDGRPARVAGMLADVTAERAAREQRKALQAQMVQTAAFEATARVAGGMANDFNNLLVGILGETLHAREQLPEDHAAQEQLAAVEATTQRAADLARELLAMSGHGRFRLSPLSINELIEEMRDALRTAVRRSGQLRLEIDPGLPLVEGDPGQLRRMLWHLVSNAVDALRGRAGRVAVQAECCLLGPDSLPWAGAGPKSVGRWICLRVVDDGEGMDTARVAELLRPFASTRDGHRGLGLAAVQGIVRGHGGHLAIQSERAQGTRVTIVLPTTSAPAPAPPSRPVPTAPPESARVLVVDDEPVVLQVSARILRNAGYTVVTATQGAEALERWHDQGPFDAVVSDLSMPVMDGEALVRALHRERPQLPILVMSGYSRSEVVGRMVGAGAVEFLAKPFRPRRLVRLVQRLLDPAVPAPTTEF